MNTSIKWEPCCDETKTLKLGTLPFNSCELHMLAPEMLDLLKAFSNETLHDKEILDWAKRLLMKAGVNQ